MSLDFHGCVDAVRMHYDHLIEWVKLLDWLHRHGDLELFIDQINDCGMLKLIFMEKSVDEKNELKNVLRRYAINKIIDHEAYVRSFMKDLGDLLEKVVENKKEE